MGVRHGIAPEFPTPTHAAHPDDIPLFGLRPWNTLGQFLETLADDNPSGFVLPSVRMTQELADLPDGSGLKSPGTAEPTRPGGHWGYRQGTFVADKTLPARTVTGSSSQDWVRWNGVLRRLTLLEVKRLQGFPDDWVLCGKQSDVFKQIGNAVPTIFGEILGNTLRRHLCASDSKLPPIAIPFPKQFEGYISYTIRDHLRNASARKIHMLFTPPSKLKSEGSGINS